MNVGNIGKRGKSWPDMMMSVRACASSSSMLTHSESMEKKKKEVFIEGVVLMVSIKILTMICCFSWKSTKNISVFRVVGTQLEPI